MKKSMTNAFAKNMFARISVAVAVLALFVGAFANTAHAEYWNEGYYSGGVPDFGGEVMYSPDTYTYYSPDTETFYSPDTTTYYSPDTETYYSPDTETYYSPDTETYYSPDTETYYSPDTYSYTPYTGTMPTYAYSAIPSVARPYMPSYVYSPTPTPSHSRQPSYAMTSTPTNNTNVNTNTNNDTSVNTNTNVASVGDIINNVAPIINVNAGPSHRPVDYEFPRPVCTMFASNNYGPTTLTWTSHNATTAFISPGVGNVAVNGAVTVYPQGYTTYTLTVTGPGGSATCQAVANYAPGYTVTPPAPHAPAPYVALSQIPYTGFDYGPVGNAMYWGALLSFAAAAGYLIVYGLPAMGLPKLALVGAFAGGRFGQRGKNEYNTAEVAEVFKQNLVTSTEVTPESEPHVEEAPAVNTYSLPVATSSHAGVTSDAMIIDRSATGAPRIVIARG